MKCACGNNTNDPEGICAVCKINQKVGEPMSKKGKCKVEGCGKDCQKGGLCYKHYKEEHGKPPWDSKKSSGKPPGRPPKAVGEQTFTSKPGLLETLKQKIIEKENELLKLREAVEVIERYV